jgi:hypothetical protein
LTSASVSSFKVSDALPDEPNASGVSTAARGLELVVELHRESHRNRVSRISSTNSAGLFWCRATASFSVSTKMTRFPENQLEVPLGAGLRDCSR